MEEKLVNLDLDLNPGEGTEAGTAEKKPRVRATKQEMEARKEVERQRILADNGMTPSEIAIYHKMKQNGLIPPVEDLPSESVINGASKFMSIQEVIFHIQQEIKVPKDRWNPIGKFHYRTVEDIYNALKKLLQSYFCTLTFGDVEYTMVGNFLIRKVSATIQHIFTYQKMTFTTSIKEDTGAGYNDACQSSGSADTYAHKMILQSLCLLDDSRLDPDTDKSAPEQEETPAQTKNETAAPAEKKQDDTVANPTPAVTAPEVKASASANIVDGKPVLAPGEADWFTRVCELAQLDKNKLEEYKSRIRETYYITEENLEALFASV